MIPCANPAAQFRSQSAEILSTIERVCEAGNYILGPEVSAFETAFAAYCDAAHAIGVNSGTDAIVLTLRAMDIGPGDEVITVSHTALATIAAIIAAGATPVCVDVDPTTYTMHPACVRDAITARSRAIIAVHVYGHPADMGAILAIGAENNIPIIEDCAQSVGAAWKGNRVGSIGHAACFSFYPTKNLGAIGDGGAIVTSDPLLAARVKRLRQYGWNANRDTEEPGLNSRLDELQAAVLATKLSVLDAQNDRRRAIAAAYSAGLTDSAVVPPAVSANVRHVFHLYVVTTERRDEIKSALGGSGVGAAVHYPVPAHLHGGYRALTRIPSTGLPVTERLARQVLSLPMYPELHDSHVAKVIDSVRAYSARR